MFRRDIPLKFVTIKLEYYFMLLTCQAELHTSSKTQENLSSGPLKSPFCYFFVQSNVKRGYFYGKVLHELLKGLFDRLWQCHVKPLLGWQKENKPNHVHQWQMKRANKENSGVKNNQKLTINCLIHQTKEEQMVKENCWLSRQRSLLSENLQLPLNSNTGQKL